MEQETIKILGKAVNGWIVQTPGRQYPGMVIQGDSLKTLYNIAQELCWSTENLEQEEVKDLASELEELLRSRLLMYETTLKEQGIELPYPNPVGGLAEG
jgi:type VI protein secretion system component VasF